MEFETFVLAASTADLSAEPRARACGDAVEYRLDLARDGIESLNSYDGDLPLIVTNRVEWEGGEAPADAARLDALETAAEHPKVGAVDIELAAIQEGEGQRVLEYARKQGVTVIVSTHDFEATPARETLQQLLQTACQYGDVGKLAVTAHDRADVLDLVTVTHEQTVAGNRVATMAMGEAGRHSRAVTPLYGSKIGYAPVDPADATAPGQYDLATLRSLLDQLQTG